ncbi:hypothetical protein P9112_002848 [Eukaryota sp. TZLM1-RC]
MAKKKNRPSPSPPNIGNLTLACRQQQSPCSSPLALSSPLQSQSSSQSVIESFLSTKLLSLSAITSPPLARLNPECLSVLTMSPGDFIQLVTSSNESVILRCFPDPSLPFSHCKLDEDSFRDLSNSKTATCSVVSIPSSVSSYAVSFPKSLPSSFIPLLHSKFVGRVLSCGSSLSFNCPPFCSCSDLFTVTDVEPSNGVVVPDSKLVIKSDDSSQLITPFAGYTSLVKDLESLLSGVFQHSHLFHSFGIPPLRSVLVYGHPGTGKKSLVRQCCFNLGIKLVEVLVSEIDKVDCNESGVCYLVSNIEQLINSNETNNSMFHSFMHKLQDINFISTNSMLLSTCSKVDLLPSSFRSKFLYELEVSVPTPQDRFEILEYYLNNSNTLIDKSLLREFTFSLHGFVGSDINNLFKLACLNSIKNSISNSKPLLLTLEYLQLALKSIRPSAIREVTLTIPNTKWTDIGGLDDIKALLKETVEWPIKFPEKFIRMGVNPPKGILLYGPPGCSKTLTAKALASEAGLNFLLVKGPEIFSKYLGESEKAIRTLFTKARAASPCIIFFDEIDALAVNRESSGNGAGERVLASLLNELDGVEGLNNVFMIAATNRPDLIDPALLRPGRLDRLVYLGLPALSSRIEVFNVCLAKTPVSPSVSFSHLANVTDGYTAAEIAAVCREASMNVMRENLDGGNVEQTHFDKALEVIKPQTTSDTIEFYLSFEKKNVRVKRNFADS